MTDVVIVSDPLRVPITAERRTDGGVAVRGHFRGVLVLSDTELDRLIAFARDEPPRARIQRFVMTPGHGSTGCLA